MNLIITTIQIITTMVLILTTMGWQTCPIQTSMGCRSTPFLIIPTLVRSVQQARILTLFHIPYYGVLYALMGEEGCYGPSLPTNTSNLTMWHHPQWRFSHWFQQSCLSLLTIVAMTSTWPCIPQVCRRHWLFVYNYTTVKLMLKSFVKSLFIACWNEQDSSLNCRISS